MIHAKSESDFATLSPPSSYPASPKPPVYYVQSPSLDSHDDADKASATASCQATPAYNSSSSPMESPRTSTYGRQSNPRSSSASRVSGNWRWPRISRKRSGKGWQECSLVEEEGVYDDSHEDDEKRSPLLAAFVGVAVVFTACCVIIWAASRPYRLQISMKSLRVHNFYLGQGSDRTGVPTKLLTVNCTATMSIHNPATFFGIYVGSKMVDLMYFEMTVATGELKRYYQPRTSSRTISVNLDGRSIPLYGAGATLDDDDTEVPLKLNMEIQSLGYLVGKLVKTKYQKRVSCSMVFNTERMEEIKFHPDSCIFN
ncbi:uncharacterized protein LOC113776396 [Coffea eugenioides]|uniref:Late embryogenesis abundant protein LEA-2 subgroup domain-containing protein n=1 Tax=Coffea arabica TaxID=13443 RepID=A0A6P6STI0_COFAR|nr:uncharacterized protein LOC113694482 [Coffea arabica]XP_027177341.1 uncharacterized protein LOC113776396 [Coffea eugenioides]